MGKLIWHQWGRLLAITSGVYMLWASFWAFLFRKFFWDMIGGTLGPAGLIPEKNTQPLVNLVVNIPLLQIFTLLLSIFTLVLELPLPFTVDCAIYYVITSGVYAVAMSKGEMMTISLNGPAGDV
uniref:DUF7727 domain-containing protein n=1 Tax=Kwoniella dejecticola CBS 10117 TaxID=1296121 RepID=A0A1A5ZWV9_9TREE|nr:uncharacterized protein I303_07054 [Kwoniella dejecticola CBS 10117]OBR82295.1 hypothetical protein I303_07054 [Kwoniella dejecticola CBS 10117]